LDRFVTITGCSGGGKSTLLRELQRRGHAVVEEPGRRIVAEELERRGTALPWIDGAAFARRAIDMALADRADAERRAGWVFFDRGLIDAASALQHLADGDVLETIGRSCRGNRSVFMAPPWLEIYVNDPARRHGFADASPSTTGFAMPIACSATTSASCRRRALKAAPTSCLPLWWRRPREGFDYDSAAHHARSRINFSDCGK
jgi:predicted ATPase